MMVVSEKPLNVLVVGAGMYVCGSGTDGFGTILPVLVQAQEQGTVGEIHIAASRPESISLLNEKLEQLNCRMGTSGKIHVYPWGDTRNEFAFRDAVKAIPKPAAAIVSTPDHLHFSMTSEIIEAGIHPMVVKPLTPTVDENRQLIQLAEKHGVYGAVEFHKRFDHANLLLRQKIRDNELGDICHVVVEFSQRRQIRDIFKSWISHTNIFQYLGVHYADMVYFLTHARPVRVMATGQTLTDYPGEYDAVQGVIEWESIENNKKFVSTILTNWIDPDSTSAMSEQKITVVGTKGRCRSDQKDRGFQLVSQESGLEDVNPYFTKLYTDNEGKFRVFGYGPESIRQFLKDVRDFVDHRVTREELDALRPTFRQSLFSTAVLEAVNVSLKENNRWVEISGLK